MLERVAEGTECGEPEGSSGLGRVGSIQDVNDILQDVVRVSRDN